MDLKLKKDYGWDGIYLPSLSEGCWKSFEDSAFFLQLLSPPLNLSRIPNFLKHCKNQSNSVLTPLVPYDFYKMIQDPSIPKIHCFFYIQNPCLNSLKIQNPTNIFFKNQDLSPKNAKIHYPIIMSPTLQLILRIFNRVNFLIVREGKEFCWFQSLSFCINSNCKYYCVNVSQIWKFKPDINLNWRWEYINPTDWYCYINLLH